MSRKCEFSKSQIECEYYQLVKISAFCMTDSSMNFGPAWIRNLPSEGTTTTGGGTGGGTRSYQLAEYRYGREEMLALFDKQVKPPATLVTFKTLYSDQTLVPLALLPTTEEEQRGWQSRPTTISGAPRGRGSSLERGGRGSRGRGGYQPYGRATSAYDSGWGNGEQPDWSPRKEFTTRTLNDNWRRVRNSNEEEDGWRNLSSSRSLHDKWGRSASWRGDGDSEERNGPPERGGRATWHENNRGAPLRRSWDNEDHLPEWATENPTEGGGTFDERGAFHGSDDEQDGKRDKKDMLQKSTSQQHIPNRANQSSLSSSKSTTSLSKSEDGDKYKEDSSGKRLKEDIPKVKESSSPEKEKYKTSVNSDERDERNSEEKCQPLATPSIGNGPPQEQIPPNIDKVDEDFDRLQEDLVLKLVVDEETPKAQPNFDVSAVQPPPNLVPPSQEKWYYQDPQGTRQGPFTHVEMAEWYKAGYFSNQLNVMRECDERYFLLGELISLCGGENPFLSNIRFPILKNEAAKLPDDMLPYQFLSQLAFKQQASLRNLAEPWSALTLQQQELAAQRLMLQQQQMPPDLQFMQQTTPTNPLMYMINQMQQSNKLPGSVLDKPNSSVPNQLDPLLVQMGNMHSLQNRMQTPGLHNHLPGGVPSNLASSLPPDGLGSSLPNLQTPQISQLPGIHGSIPTGLPGSLNVNRPTSHTSMDQLPPGQDSDPLANFLKQFQQQRQMPMDTLWQKQNQFGVAPPVSTSTQWPQQTDTSISMWDIQPPPTSEGPLQDKSSQEKEKEQRPKEELSQKELKKRKEQEEKQAKKEAEERRKLEQKKQEAEKKAAEDKRRKEEERIRKELEKAKKEAEEKRLRELEEKRRLKEQRKAEEEMRKKNEELKKIEDEKTRRENKEKEEKKQAEAARLHAAKGASKTAPWCQSNFTPGLNLTDIQKAEKEKRASEVASQIQKQQQLQELQQQQIEKSSGLQLNWAKKPIETRKVKSVAEIQAEEQERLSKLSAEARLAAQLKEKEAPVSNSGSIWNGQSLSWANVSSTSQWSSSSAGGFWDEVPPKSSNKPSTVSKSNSTSAMTTTKQQQQKQSKIKTKKEESPKSINNNNNQSKDEFTDWCYKTLSNISADVDIPTFVTFLRDIESAYDVRDYCKEYLGESPATQQFASNFLEKRRSFKPKNNAHKDDMCSPAPAITPSLQHSNEFQEVKGKNKKNKKSKMLKVDSRILGFNVTSAPDRINVGDRDYGDNS